MAESDATITLHGELLSAELTIDSRAFWLDLGDRALKTFLQNVAIFLGAGATIVSVSWPAALSAAGLATLVSVLLAFVASASLTSGNFLIDLGDRVARTFAGSLVAAIPATGGFADVNWRDALTIAATAAALSAITSLATVNLGAAKGVPSTAPVRTVIDVEPESVTDYQAGSSSALQNKLGDPGEPIPYTGSNDAGTGRTGADN